MLILHGTAGSGADMLAKDFAGELFGPGQPLDASRWESSDDYNPSPGLERIQAALLAINSAADERSPPELGILEREIKRVKNGRYVLIPASGKTRGHGTTGMAALWKQYLEELLREAPRRGKWSQRPIAEPLPHFKKMTRIPSPPYPMFARLMRTRARFALLTQFGYFPNSC